MFDAASSARIVVIGAGFALDPRMARTDQPQIQNEPKPPFPDRKLAKPDIEAELSPRPRYQAPKYKPAGKLEGKAYLFIDDADALYAEYASRGVEFTRATDGVA